ncbi:hypothetical protein B0T18DRAFT_219338 [Schizothecium vesticola]|uniref:Uncharacterized protein n=1 Tax=Schizothecium vesticola TaxID=314040 RepID=A0AA40JZZ3_9PEZI|nr:hypothetical protein B0T18DRAFT_219338 [Schizothecium vesticola]
MLGVWLGAEVFGNNACFDVFVKDAWAFVSVQSAGSHDRGREAVRTFGTPPTTVPCPGRFFQEIRSQDSTGPMSNSSLAPSCHGNIPSLQTPVQIKHGIIPPPKKRHLSPQLHDNDMTSPSPRHTLVLQMVRSAALSAASFCHDPAKPCHDWSRHHPSAAIAWREGGASSSSSRPSISCLQRHRVTTVATSEPHWSPSRWVGDNGRWPYCVL